MSDYDSWLEKPYRDRESEPQEYIVDSYSYEEGIADSERYSQIYSGEDLELANDVFLESMNRFQERYPKSSWKVMGFEGRKISFSLSEKDKMNIEIHLYSEPLD